MTTQGAERTLTQDREAIAFAKRAMLDFGLSEEFESRSAEEQFYCLQWVNAAVDERQQECRISRLLDDLAANRPLPGT